MVYVGRIVAAGRTRAGRNAVLYRVSSRSFPNREAVETEGAIAIVPREGTEADVRRSPYIAYAAMRLAGDWCVATNGSHTDPIAEKIASGMAPRDALALALQTLDYERDALNTPRIAAVLPRVGDTAWLGIVRDDALAVAAVQLQAGAAHYLATYEANAVRAEQRSVFDAASAHEAARYAVEGGAFADFEYPVAAAAALATDGGFEWGTYRVD